MPRLLSDDDDEEEEETDALQSGMPLMNLDANDSPRQPARWRHSRLDIKVSLSSNMSCVGREILSIQYYVSLFIIKVRLNLQIFDLIRTPKYIIKWRTPLAKHFMGAERTNACSYGEVSEWSSTHLPSQSTLTHGLGSRLYPALHIPREITWLGLETTAENRGSSPSPAIIAHSFLVEDNRILSINRSVLFLSRAIYIMYISSFIE